MTPSSGDQGLAADGARPPSPRSRTGRGAPARRPRRSRRPAARRRNRSGRRPGRTRRSRDWPAAPVQGEARREPGDEPGHRTAGQCERDATSSSTRSGAIPPGSGRSGQHGQLEHQRYRGQRPRSVPARAIPLAPPPGGGRIADGRGPAGGVSPGEAAGRRRTRRTRVTGSVTADREGSVPGQDRVPRVVPRRLHDHTDHVQRRELHERAHDRHPGQRTRRAFHRHDVPIGTPGT